MGILNATGPKGMSGVKIVLVIACNPQVDGKMCNAEEHG